MNIYKLLDRDEQVQYCRNYTDSDIITIKKMKSGDVFTASNGDKVEKKDNGYMILYKNGNKGNGSIYTDDEAF